MPEPRSNDSGSPESPESPVDPSRMSFRLLNLYNSISGPPGSHVAPMTVGVPGKPVSGPPVPDIPKHEYKHEYWLDLKCTNRRCGKRCSRFVKATGIKRMSGNFYCPECGERGDARTIADSQYATKPTGKLVQMPVEPSGTPELLMGFAIGLVAMGLVGWLLSAVFS